ncbi:MAG: hypothetical protein HYU67_09145 [Flavobacteriia bacterium]|nr:hypothetical protein [Flavobacteriia bacterium]
MAIGEFFGTAKYQVDSTGKNEKNGFFEYISLDSNVKIIGNFRNGLKNGKFIQELKNVKKTENGIYHQITSNSEGFYDFGKLTGKWRSDKKEILFSPKKDTNNYFLSIMHHNGLDLSGELQVSENAHAIFEKGKFNETFFYQINENTVSGYCNKQGLVDGKIVSDYFSNKIKIREIAVYEKGILCKLTQYIGEDKEDVLYDQTALVHQFLEKMDTLLKTAEVNGKTYEIEKQNIKYADKTTPFRLQALAFWLQKNQIETTNASIFYEEGSQIDPQYSPVYLLQEIKSIKKTDSPEISTPVFNEKLPKLVAFADSLYQVKSYREALENYSKAMVYNIDSVNDKNIETHLNKRIEELKRRFTCEEKFVEAKLKYENKAYYEGLELIKPCAEFDKNNLISLFEQKIKFIEDSILFEKYLIEIKEKAQKLEYRIALEKIVLAKALKFNHNLDSIEKTYQQILDGWVKKNKDRNALYKELNDKFIAYAQKSDALTLKLLEIKDYYHEKFDTCIGFLKHGEKEFVQKVKSHEDFDSGKNEFKITDYWSENDEESMKNILLLKDKYEYHFTFVDKVDQAVQKQDTAKLRNFKKYVYIKDIVMVFVKDM